MFHLLGTMEAGYFRIGAICVICMRFSPNEKGSFHEFLF
jgi:hypothetical protein